MADNEITWESKGADKVARDARDVAKAHGDLTGEMEKGAGRVERYTDRMAKMAVQMAVVKGLVVDGVKGFAEQQAAVGRLERSFGNADRRAGTFAETLSVLRGRSRTLGVDFNEQVDALSQLIDQTGDAEQAHKDLALAVDIASQENMALTDAVGMLRKARNGEVEELKNLDGINKDLAASLGKITDSSDRADEAIRILTNSYSGAAEENKGLEEQLRSFEEQIDEVRNAIGELAAAFIAEDGLIAQMGNLFGILEEGETILTKTADTWRGIAADVKSGEVSKIATLGPRALLRTFGVLDGPAPEGSDSKADNPRPPTFQNTVDEVPEPDEVATEGGRKKKRGGGGGAGGGEKELTDAEFIELQAKEIEQRQANRDAILAEAEAIVELNRAKQEEVGAVVDHKKAKESFRDFSLNFNKEQREEALENEKKQKAATQESIAAGEAMALGALDVAGTFMQGENAKNIKAGLGETAKAAAAIATGVTTGNPMQFVGAGLHVLAAGKYFAAAGQNTGVAPKGGGGGGGSAGGGSAPSVPSVPSASTRENADLVGEQGPAAASRGAVYVYQSLWPPTAQQVRDTRRYIEADARRDV